jgi:hypothetical protein
LAIIPKINPSYNNYLWYLENYFREKFFREEKKGNIIEGSLST